MSTTESLHRFLGLPLALQPEYLVLYARKAGWFMGIRVMCPNHMTCCCLMCCRTGFAPAMSRITSFLILSRLVLFTAFLKHFIPQVTSFLSRSFVSDHVWHWYVSVGHVRKRSRTHKSHQKNGEPQRYSWERSSSSSSRRRRSAAALPESRIATDVNYHWTFYNSVKRIRFPFKAKATSSSS